MELPVVKVLWMLAKLVIAATLVTLSSMIFAGTETVKGAAGVLLAMLGVLLAGSAGLMLYSLIRPTIDENV